MLSSHVFTHNCLLSSHDDSYISERIHLRLSSFDFFCCLFCITVVALFMICVASWHFCSWNNYPRYVFVKSHGLMCVELLICSTIYAFCQPSSWCVWKFDIRNATFFSWLTLVLTKKCKMHPTEGTRFEVKKTNPPWLCRKFIIVYLLPHCMVVANARIVFCLPIAGLLDTLDFPVI